MGPGPIQVFVFEPVRYIGNTCMGIGKCFHHTRTVYIEQVAHLYIWAEFGKDEEWAGPLLVFAPQPVRYIWNMWIYVNGLIIHVGWDASR